MYIHFAIRFTWDEANRRRNIRDHGFDFVDAPRVFEGPTFTYEDDRLSYREQRFVTLGFLGEYLLLSITRKQQSVSISSFRRATAHEEIILFESLQD